MKTRSALLLRDLGILAILLVIYIHCVCSYRSRFAPARGVRTFADLQRQGIPLKRAVVLPHLEGHVCVFADGDSLLWTLPSGPPAYHFDRTGRLIDFTPDVGDSTLFQRDYDIYRGKEIPMTDLAGAFAGNELPEGAEPLAQQDSLDQHLDVDSFHHALQPLPCLLPRRTWP